MRRGVSRVVDWLGGPTQAMLSGAAFLMSILIGVAAFTFGYANGWAYFGKDPKACQQCHSMNKQYNAWEKGSHKNVATCQDCHSPQDNIVKWAYEEADNGFWHSLKFTTGWYPENIKIREMNRETTQANCLRCHKDFVDNIEGTRLTRPHDQQVNCIQCHKEVGHKR